MNVTISAWCMLLSLIMVCRFSAVASLMGCITVLIFWKLENNRMRAGNISKEISSAGNSNNPSLAISLRTE